MHVSTVYTADDMSVYLVPVRILPRQLLSRKSSVDGPAARRRTQNALPARQNIGRLVLHKHAVGETRNGGFPARWRHFGVVLHSRVVEVGRCVL